MNDDPYPTFDSPRFTDDDGELPRAAPVACQWCGKPLPPFLRGKHEEHCEQRPANEFEAVLRWYQAKRMAGGAS